VAENVRYTAELSGISDRFQTGIPAKKKNSKIEKCSVSTNNLMEKNNYGNLEF
jgi:hypothetical protein